MLCGQGVHDRRLNHRNQRHVGVSGNGDGSHQFRCQVVCDVDSGRAVSTADDADSCCLGRCEEAGSIGQNECNVDTELCCSTQKKGYRVRNQGTEVRHRADCHEYQAGEQGALIARIDDLQNAGLIPGQAVCGCIIHQSCQGQVGKKHTECDREKQKRLILLLNRQIHKNK